LIPIVENSRTDFTISSHPVLEGKGVAAFMPALRHQYTLGCALYSIVYTVFPRIEAPASISTIMSDPWPVFEARPVSQ